MHQWQVRSRPLQSRRQVGPARLSRLLGPAKNGGHGALRRKPRPQGLELGCRTFPRHGQRYRPRRDGIASVQRRNQNENGLRDRRILARRPEPGRSKKVLRPDSQKAVAKTKQTLVGTAASAVPPEPALSEVEGAKPGGILPKQSIPGPQSLIPNP